MGGYWAPLTMEGSLLVEGFLASSYASYTHQVGQLLSSLRLVPFMPRLFLDDENSQHENGVRNIVKVLKAVATKVGLRDTKRRHISGNMNIVCPKQNMNTFGELIGKSLDI